MPVVVLLMQAAWHRNHCQSVSPASHPHSFHIAHAAAHSTAQSQHSKPKSAYHTSAPVATAIAASPLQRYLEFLNAGSSAAPPRPIVLTRQRPKVRIDPHQTHQRRPARSPVGVIPKSPSPCPASRLCDAGAPRQGLRDHEPRLSVSHACAHRTSGVSQPQAPTPPTLPISTRRTRACRCRPNKDGCRGRAASQHQNDRLSRTKHGRPPRNSPARAGSSQHARYRE